MRSKSQKSHSSKRKNEDLLLSSVPKTRSLLLCTLCNKPYNLTLRVPLVLSCCGDTLCKECWHLGFNPRPSNTFYCPYRCKRVDHEEQKKPQVNVAIRRLVEANLPVDVTCDRHRGEPVSGYSLTEKRLICQRCPTQGISMELDGRQISECCTSLRNNLQVRFDDIRLCIDVLDDLISGRGPMTSIQTLQVLQRSHRLASDMYKTAGERESLFFLKDVKTVVVEDFDTFSQKSSARLSSSHTRSHTVLGEQQERLSSNAFSQYKDPNVMTPQKRHFNQPMKPPKAPLNMTPSKTLTYKHHAMTSTGSSGFSPQRLMLTVNPTPAVKDSVFMECHSNLLKGEEAIRLISKGLGGRRFQLQLLMRGSIEGYQANYFHTVSDGKGPTLTVVQSEHDYIFGGYTSVSWSRNITYYPDLSAFLFQLNKNTLHFPYRNKECAVRHHSGCLPTFGGGFGFGTDNDLYISEACDRYRNSYCNLGETYSLGARGMNYGSDEARRYMAGTYKFLVKEMEVFRVNFLD